MSRVAIIDYVRTPFTLATLPGSGKAPGQMAHVEPINLIVPLIQHLMQAHPEMNPKDVENVILGIVHPEGQQGLNLARMAVLHKDSPLPNSVQGETLDKFCGSSMRTISMAEAEIRAGRGDIFIAGGLQSMSLIPMGGRDSSTPGDVLAAHPAGFMDMGITAENLAALYQITRAEQEAFALQSHQRAAAARAAGHFDKEIVPINDRDGMPIGQDDIIRGESLDPEKAKAMAEKMATLRTVFKRQEQGGTVTAATSSGVADGASAVLMTSVDYAKAHNLPIKAEIVSFAGSGCDPETMGLGPVEAAKKALERAHLTMADIDVIELNEAFAAQALAVMKEWDKQGMHADPAKVNIDGGAIALGHPLGASGARLVGHAANILERENKRYALATMCIGGGQGVAMVIENPNFKP
jgi:acetyl-CoA acyltransferase